MVYRTLGIQMTPTYEYVCSACKHSFEDFQGMSDPIKRKCPKCGKLKLKRLIGSGGGFLFKGPGFYQTDYPSESYKKDKKRDE
jgi:putative FmdB family regulatory protein